MADWNERMAKSVGMTTDEFAAKIRRLREDSRTGEPWELAVWSDETWELVGDFPSRDAAIAAARNVHAQGAGDVFGVSGDPASGHYETRLEFRDGELTVA